MPRRKKNRIVNYPPIFTDFKPVGIQSRSLQELILSLDEYEAIRLADFVGLNHIEAAEEMEISRSTFTRLILQARKKLADFLVNGKVLSISGGNIHFRGNIIKCLNCGHMFNTKFQENFTHCPSCGSSQLVDLAGGFGHGECCGKRNRGRR